MLKLKHKNIFLKDRKQAERRGKDIAKLAEVMFLLAMEEQLNPKYKDHPLNGIYKGYRECHIENDWLLIYKIEGDTITFVRNGTHSDLFK